MGFKTLLLFYLLASCEAGPGASVCRQAESNDVGGNGSDIIRGDTGGDDETRLGTVAVRVTALSVVVLRTWAARKATTPLAVWQLGLHLSWPLASDVLLLDGMVCLVVLTMTPLGQLEARVTVLLQDPAGFYELCGGVWQGGALWTQ